MTVDQKLRLKYINKLLKNQKHINYYVNKFMNKIYRKQNN
jgi:hypothetical protein